jgi:PAS domain S-box-containing protein
VARGTSNIETPGAQISKLVKSINFVTLVSLGACLVLMLLGFKSMDTAKLVRQSLIDLTRLERVLSEPIVTPGQIATEARYVKELALESNSTNLVNFTGLLDEAIKAKEWGLKSSPAALLPLLGREVALYREKSIVTESWGHFFLGLGFIIIAIAGLLKAFFLSAAMGPRVRDLDERLFDTMAFAQAADEKATELQVQLNERRLAHLSATIELADMRRVIQANHRRFEVIFWRLPIACFSLNESGRVMEWNFAAETLIGKPAQQVIDREVWEVVATEDGGRTLKDHLYQAFVGAESEAATITLLLPNNQQMQVAWRAMPIFGETGAVVGVINNLEPLSKPYFASQPVEPSPHAA